MRLATIAVVVCSIAGCGSFGAADAPPAAADGGAVDAPVDAGSSPNADGGSGALPTAQDCAERGVPLDSSSFDTLPPAGWTEADPDNLVTLDSDVADVVSAPSSLRAGVTARASGDIMGVIERVFPQALTGTLCISFQGRLELGTEGFGASSTDFVGLFGVDLTDGAAGARSGLGVAISAGGLRAHFRDATRDLASESVAYGDGLAFRRWTLVIAPSLRKAALSIGASTVEVPFDPTSVSPTTTIQFGAAASGQVPEVAFHVDDLKIAVLP